MIKCNFCVCYTELSRAAMERRAAINGFPKSQLVTELRSSFFKTYQGMAVRCLRCRTTPPTFLMWNNFCDLVYQTPTKTYRSQIPVAFGIPGHVTSKHLPDMPLLGHRKRTQGFTSHSTKIGHFGDVFPGNLLA